LAPRANGLVFYTRVKVDRPQSEWLSQMAAHWGIRPFRIRPVTISGYSGLMRCPYCQIDNDKVIDSRASEDGSAIRRRRECLGCRRRYTTFERVEEVSIRVIKKDGNRVPFDRAKIKSGLEKACWKRPISDEQIDSAVSAVEREIYDRFENEVETRDIGELVMKELGKLDQVAYVRFASVYREFKDARDFVEELEPILNESKRSPR
jgi:transcriptional repressor NrdR